MEVMSSCLKSLAWKWIQFIQVRKSHVISGNQDIGKSCGIVFQVLSKLELLLFIAGMLSYIGSSPPLPPRP